MPLTLQLRRFRWSATWPMTLLTLAAMVLFFNLGRWQWHRGELKRALAQQFSAGAESVAELGERPTAALPRYAQVRLQGSYDGEHQFLLDNMSHDGLPGYQVLTPLHLNDGRTVIVNRGWVPLTERRSQPPDVHIDGAFAPAASSAPLQTATGRLDDLPVAGIALGHVPPPAGDAWPKLTSFPTIEDLSAALGRPLQSRQLLLNPDQPAGFVRDWHPPGLGAERHLSYAIQWWAFGALTLILYGYMNWRRSPQ
ncbi:MAG TPA: SURF1 family protein [Steroidobacteraceae bacterium]